MAAKVIAGFVSGGKRATAFQPSDTALDPIASAVEVWIEGSCAALPCCRRCGVDHGPDMALTQRAEDSHLRIHRMLDPQVPS